MESFTAMAGGLFFWTSSIGIMTELEVAGVRIYRDTAMCTNTGESFD